MNRGMGQESFYRTRIEMGHDFFFFSFFLSWDWDGTGVFLLDWDGTGLKIHSCVTL